MRTNTRWATLSLISGILLSLAACGMTEDDARNAYDAVDQALRRGSDNGLTGTTFACRFGGSMTFDPAFNGSAPGGYQHQVTFSKCSEQPSGTPGPWVFDGTVQLKRYLVGEGDAASYETSYVGDLTYSQGFEAECHIDMVRGHEDNGERHHGTACGLEVDYTLRGF